MTSSFSFMSRVLQVVGWADLPSDPTFPPGHTRKTKNYFALQVIANIPENSNDPSRTLSQTSLTNSEPGRPDFQLRNKSSEPSGADANSMRLSCSFYYYLKKNSSFLE